LNYTLEQKKKIESNIWKYTVLLVTGKRAFAAVLSLYYLTVPNVEVQNIGWITFFGSIASFLFEIPSGFLSDKIGHRRTLILSQILMAISSILFIISSNFILLIIAAVFMSLSFACASGTGSAFMHDTLKAIGRNNDYSKIMGKASSIGFAVPIAFMVLSPFLMEYSYKAPFVLALLLDMVGLAVSLSLTQVDHSEEHKKQVKETKLKQVFAEGIKVGYMPFAIFTAFVSGFIFALQIYRAPYQEFIGADVIWFGVYFGLGRALVSLLLAYNGKIKEKFNIYSFQKFKIVLFSSLILILGLSDNFMIIIVTFIIMNGFFLGLSQAGSHFTLEIIGHSKFKATLLSIRGQINQAVSAASVIGVGYLISIYSYQNAFIILAIVFCLVSTLLYLNIIYKTKSLKLKNEL